MNEIEKYTDKGIDLVDVTGVDSALQELDISEYDKHPEKRMRSVISNKIGMECIL